MNINVKKMGYKKYFLRAIKKHYPDNAGSLMSEIDGRYEIISSDVGFASTSSNPMDRRLNFSAYFLALIQVLENQGDSFEQIRKICLEVTYDYVRPKNKFQSWLKRLPAKLVNIKLIRPLLKVMDRKVGTKGHPDGFVARVITGEKETYGLGYGIDILECGICKLFQKNGARKYASILCEVDKMTSGLAGLELIRTGTIATGAKKCDFRFKKVG